MREPLFYIQSELVRLINKDVSTSQKPPICAHLLGTIEV